MMLHPDRQWLEGIGTDLAEYREGLAARRPGVAGRVAEAAGDGSDAELLAGLVGEVVEECLEADGMEFLLAHYSGQTSLEEWLALVTLRRWRSHGDPAAAERAAELDYLDEVLAGDPAACKRFLGEARSWLERFLLPKAGDSRQKEVARRVIDDVLSDLFGRELLRTFKGTGSLQGWVCRIGLRRFFDELKRASYRMETGFPTDEAGNTLEDVLFAAPPAPETDPVVLNTLLEGLRNAFGSLTPRELFLVRLVHLHDVERQALANLLGVHPATIGRELTQILERVSQTLNKFLRAVNPDGDLDLSEYVNLAEHFREALHGTLE